MPDLTELQRLAEGATPGRWWVQVYANRKNGASLCTLETDGPNMDSVADGLYEHDARYVAAMSPDTAKKLIAVALAASENMGALEEATGYVMDGIRSPSLASEHRAAVAALRKALEELK